MDIAFLPRLKSRLVSIYAAHTILAVDGTNDFCSYELGLRFHCKQSHTESGKRLPNDHVAFYWSDDPSRGRVLPVRSDFNFPRTVDNRPLHKPVVQKWKSPEP